MGGAAFGGLPEYSGFWLAAKPCPLRFLRLRILRNCLECGRDSGLFAQPAQKQKAPQGCGVPMCGALVWCLSVTCPDIAVADKNARLSIRVSNTAFHPASGYFS